MPFDVRTVTVLTAACLAAIGWGMQRAGHVAGVVVCAVAVLLAILAMAAW